MYYSTYCLIYKYIQRKNWFGSEYELSINIYWLQKGPSGFYYSFPSTEKRVKVIMHPWCSTKGYKCSRNAGAFQQNKNSMAKWFSEYDWRDTMGSSRSGACWCLALATCVCVRLWWRGQRTPFQPSLFPVYVALFCSLLTGFHALNDNSLQSFLCVCAFGLFIFNQTKWHHDLIVDTDDNDIFRAVNKVLFFKHKSFELVLDSPYVWWVHPSISVCMMLQRIYKQLGPHSRVKVISRWFLDHCTTDECSNLGCQGLTALYIYFNFHLLCFGLEF